MLALVGTLALLSSGCEPAPAHAGEDARPELSEPEEGPPDEVRDPLRPQEPLPHDDARPPAHERFEDDDDEGWSSDTAEPAGPDEDWLI